MAITRKALRLQATRRLARRRMATARRVERAARVDAMAREAAAKALAQAESRTPMLPHGSIRWVAQRPKRALLVRPWLCADCGQGLTSRQARAAVVDGCPAAMFSPSGRRLRKPCGSRNIMLRRTVNPSLVAEREPRREDHCTHPEKSWCDCDWCRYLRPAYDESTNPSNGWAVPE